MPLDVLEIYNVKSKSSAPFNVCTLILTKTFIKTPERREEKVYLLQRI